MEDLNTAERLSALIGQIYDCAIDITRWAETIDATASLDLVALPTGQSLLNIMANIPEPFASRMLNYAPQVADMWAGPTS